MRDSPDRHERRERTPPVEGLFKTKPTPLSLHERAADVHPLNEIQRVVWWPRSVRYSMLFAYFLDQFMDQLELYSLIFLTVTLCGSSRLVGSL